jgi:hypothetical protein
VYLFDRIRLYDTSVEANNNDDNHNANIHSINGINGSPREGVTTANNNAPPRDPKRRRKPPRCIAWKESLDRPLSVVPEAYERFLKHKMVNDNATCEAELYSTTTTPVNPKRQRNSSIDTAIPRRLREAFAIARQS